MQVYPPISDKAEKDLKTPAANIVKLRAAKGFSQQYVADRCLIDRTTYSHIERGYKSPSICSYFAALAVMGVASLDDHPALAMKIYETRVAKGLTRFHAALNANLSRTTYRNIEESKSASIGFFIVALDAINLSHALVDLSLGKTSFRKNQ